MIDRNNFKDLHDALGFIILDYVGDTGKQISDIKIADLTQWSHQRSLEMGYLPWNGGNSGCSGF